jgi:predicted amino acid dehydrogenase
VGPRKHTTVVNITFQGEEWDYDERVSVAGHRYRLIRVGADGTTESIDDRVRHWSQHADAIAVSGLREARADGRHTGADGDLRHVTESTTAVPVRDGALLTDIFQEWAIRRIEAEMPGYFVNARVVVVGDTTRERTVTVLREFTDNIVFDSGHDISLPGQLKTNPVTATTARIGEFAWRQVPALVKDQVAGPIGWATGKLAHRAAVDADVIIGSFSELMRFGLPDLAGKAVITSTVNDERLATLAELGADLVVDVTPQPFGFMVVPAMYEAMVAATLPDGAELTTDRLVRFIQDAELEPRLIWPHGRRRKSRFAFVIHPLSTEYFKNVEPLGRVTSIPGMSQVVEKTVAYIPPFVYSHVTGIVSDTGDEAEGWLITVGGTPKEMLAHPPEFTYSRLLAAADLARNLGAQIMGLGAFTKVVGDAGVTVAKQASLPVTTGNSYSASGALWAAGEALRRLGIAEVDADGVMHGKTMVVGASGAIGSACARLLALASDELWLVSPETAKLLQLKRDIERDDPRATVHVATDPSGAIADMDLIVTATSAAGHKVLDIMNVKPGCVITDVARPLDMSAEDVAKRPDVLVIESGEVELPGEARMKNIGLPDRTVYACLAETIVLALEGRYENFTVGRNISWPKVKEIYRLGLKHGMKLATISGVNGPYTDEDFDRVRTAALAARASAGGTDGKAAG